MRRYTLGILLLISLPPLVGVSVAMAGNTTAIALFSAILTITGILWAFSLLNEFVPPLIALLISLFIGLAPSAEALKGFASPALFTVLGVISMAGAIRFTGLGERFGLFLLTRLPNNPLMQQLGMIGTGLMLSPFVPLSSTRTALMLPIFDTSAQLLNLPWRGRTITALMAATFGGANIFSSLLATSKIGSLIGISFLPRQDQETFLGLFWLKASFLLIIVLLVTQIVLLRRIQGDVMALPLDRSVLNAQWEQLGAINREQWFVIGALITFILGLVTQSLHHIDLAWISGLALVILLVSGVLSQQRFREALDWPAFFFLIGYGSLVDVINYLGFADLLATHINHWFGFVSTSIWLFIAACFVITVVVRLALPLNTGMLVAFMLTLPLAIAQNLNPWVCLFLCNVFSEIWFLPYQNSSYVQLISKYGDQFDQPHFLACKQWLDVASLVGVVFSVPWWTQLGLI